MFRQSLESICMSILLATDQKVDLSKKKPNIDFFNEFNQEYNKLLKNQKASTYYTLTHLSYGHVEKNATKLGVDTEAFEELKKSKDFYNKYSHSSILTMGARMTEVRFRFGCGVEDLDLSIYAKEIDGRVNYAKIIPDFIETIYLKLKTTQ